ncbi:hypothetical protein CYMTET_30558 [Cymbomonas tetramitiformis]|uniref:Uncharacterized protein n=1 Tax=Cymbomonas tetramitiformis TaxID=36881 RepID=A0AAE0FIR2_9CHLO|nr:hypothetical protein CYMTET_30558 [Cymbomonas tetramitiformis]
MFMSCPITDGNRKRFLGRARRRRTMFAHDTPSTPFPGRSKKQPGAPIGPRLRLRPEKLHIFSKHPPTGQGASLAFLDYVLVSCSQSSYNPPGPPRGLPLSQLAYQANFVQGSTSVLIPRHCLTDMAGRIVKAGGLEYMYTTGTLKRLSGCRLNYKAETGIGASGSPVMLQVYITLWAI